MVGKYFLLVAVVVLASQGQAQRQGNPISELVDEYLDLTLRILGAVFENKKIDQQCFDSFKSPPPVPEIVIDEVNKCGEKYADLLKEFVDKMPPTLKKKIQDLESSREQSPTSLIEVIGMLGEVHYVIKDIAKYIREANIKAVISDALKCTMPIFEHVKTSFRGNVEEFVKCAKL